MKETIIKSVTAVICVIAVCVSSVLAIGKYGDAMVETAKHTPASASTSGGGSSATGGTSGGSTVDPSATPDATTPDAGTTDAATPDASTPSSGSSAGTSTGGNASSGGSSATSTDPTKYSKEQIVAYYNNSIKATAKAPKLSVTKKEVISIVVDSMKPNSNTLKNIINEHVLSK